jgi:hypothetical protein
LTDGTATDFFFPKKLFWKSWHYIQNLFALDLKFSRL